MRSLMTKPLSLKTDSSLASSRKSYWLRSDFRSSLRMGMTALGSLGSWETRLQYWAVVGSQEIFGRYAVSTPNRSANWSAVIWPTFWTSSAKAAVKPGSSGFAAACTTDPGLPYQRYRSQPVSKQTPASATHIDFRDMGLLPSG